MRILIKVLIGTLAVLVASYVLPGVRIEGLATALVAAVVLAVVNAVIKPLFIILTLPVTILSLGLFLLVINALMVELAAWLVPGFYVAGFWWALLFSLVVSLVTSVLEGLAGEENH